MPQQRIAFLDIDGTIIDRHERIRPSTIEAVHRARERGHLVYISTGRSPLEILPDVRDIGFDGEVTAGGAFAVSGGERVVSETMTPAQIERLNSFLTDAGLDYYLQSFDAVYPSEHMLDHFMRLLAADGEDTDEHPVSKLFGASRGKAPVDVAKGLFIGESQGAFDVVSSELEGEFVVITGTIPHLGGASGEISMLGVNKGSAALAVLNRVGMSPADAIAVGDSSNDLELFDVVGTAVAMGNANDVVKARAHQVTSSVEFDGVWDAFTRNGLI